MAKTFNRRPASVPTPSSSDVKNYFATQTNWKGVVTNKNFLAVDQESFEDADNVFVDDDFVLRSRPAIKQSWDENDVQDVTYFDNDIIITVRSNNIIITFADKSQKIVDKPEDFRFVQIDKGILFFTSDKIQLIDKLGSITDSDIYVPKTKIVNLDGTEEKLESKNVFTDAEITVYLYLSSERNFNNESKLLGKKVKIKNGKDYELEFTFNKYFSQTIIKEFSSLSNNLILNYKIFDEDYKYSPIAISSANTFAFIDVDTCQIYYSSDGVIFNIICSVPKESIITDGERVNTIQFARDNPALLYVTLVKDSETFSVNVISVESDMPDGSLRYPILTELYNYLEHSFSFFPVDYDKIYFVSYFETPGGTCPRISNIYTAQTVYEFYDYLDAQIINMIVINEYIIITLSFNHTKQLLVLSVENDEEYYNIITNLYIDLLSINVIFLGNDLFRGYGELDNVIYYYTFSLDGTLSRSTYNGRLLGINSTSTYMFTDGFKYYEFENSLSSNIDFIDRLKFVDYYQHLDCCFISSNYSKYIYWIAKFNENNCKIYSNNVNEIIELESYNEGQSNIIVPAHISELTNLFMSKDNILHISQMTENEAIYFPEINKQTFASKITNLQPLSESEMGVFLNDEIHYCYLTENGYAYRKSRLDFGCKEGNDIETSFDGKYTLFDTDRGLAALSYQDFVASTEQSVTFVSDAIQSRYDIFRKPGVKLTKYKNYLLLYNKDSLLLYDMRNSSWWPWSVKNINKIIRHDDTIHFILDNRFCDIDYNDKDYYDALDKKSIKLIHWKIKSQKMHLNANNNYKHIINMTFSAIGEAYDNPLSIKLKVTNYRHFVNEGKEETFDYKVQLIRTFVKRLNYSKVREFQYELSMDTENVIPIPLRLSAITTKYKIGGQVR